MAKLIYYVAASIDGFIADDSGSVDWLDKYNGVDGQDYGYANLLRQCDVVLIGSKTYEQMLGFGSWDLQHHQVFVVSSRSLPQPEHATVRFVGGPVIEVVNKCKAAANRDVWVCGGGSLAGSLMAEHLIDELVLTTVPTMLGSGVRLFGSEPGQPIELNMQSTELYDNGMRQSRYTVKGTSK